MYSGLQDGADLQALDVLELVDRPLAVGDAAVALLHEAEARPGPSRAACPSASCRTGRRARRRPRVSLAKANGKSRTTNSLIMPTSCAGAIIDASIVPPCIAEATCCSPPSVPPAKTLTFILPPLFCSTSVGELLRADALRMVHLVDDRELDVAVLDVGGRAPWRRRTRSSAATTPAEERSSSGACMVVSPEGRSDLAA